MKINIRQIPRHTWISLAMVILVIVNHILTSLGKPVINLGEVQITAIVNGLIDFAVIAYAAWKNQSVTTFAQIADGILYALRDGKVTKEEVLAFLEEHVSQTED